MIKEIDGYIFNQVEKDEIVVSARMVDNGEETYRIVMFFSRRGSQIFTQGDMNDDDYILIQSNAIKIFKGIL